MRKDIIIFIVFISIVIWFVANIGINMYDSVSADALYKQAEIDINKDRTSDMTQSEIHDIIRVNCERYMKTESDVFYCIYKYKTEN